MNMSILAFKTESFLKGSGTTTAVKFRVYDNDGGSISYNNSLSGATVSLRNVDYPSVIGSIALDAPSSHEYTVNITNSDIPSTNRMKLCVVQGGAVVASGVVKFHDVVPLEFISNTSYNANLLPSLLNDMDADGLVPLPTIADISSYRICVASSTEIDGEGACGWRRQLWGELATGQSTRSAIGFTASYKILNHTCHKYVVHAYPDGGSWTFKLYKGEEYPECASDSVLFDPKKLYWNASGSIDSDLSNTTGADYGSDRYFVSPKVSERDSVLRRGIPLGTTTGTPGSEVVFAGFMNFTLGSVGASVTNLKCVEFYVEDDSFVLDGAVLSTVGSSASLHDFGVPGGYTNGYYRIAVIPTNSSVNYLPYNRVEKVEWLSESVRENLKARISKTIVYTNSIDGRHAVIPFTLKVGEGDSADDLEGEPLSIDTVRAAYDGSVADGLNGESVLGDGDYPYMWTGMSNDVQPNPVNRTLWNTAYIETEYDEESHVSTYYLHAPFGKSSIPSGNFIRFEGFPLDELNGYYVPDGQDGEYPKYRQWGASATYYIRCVPIYKIRSGSVYSLSFTGDEWNAAMVWVISTNETGDVSDSTAKVLSCHFFSDEAYSSQASYQNGFTWSKENIASAFGGGLSWDGGADFHPTPNTGGCVLGITEFTVEGNSITASIQSGINVSSGDGSTMQDNQYKTVYFSFANGSSWFTPAGSAGVRLQIHATPPTSISLSVIGSSGDSHYTGFYRKEGRFFPSEYAQVLIGAVSDIGMSYELTGSIKSPIHGSELKSGVTYRHLVKLNPNSTDLPKSLFSTEIPSLDSAIGLTLTVTDEAGNEAPPVQDNSIIQFIRSLYRTANLNLREPSSEYSHEVYYSNGTEIQERRQGSEFSRSWNEIWYPSTHGSPLNSDGTIDAVEAKRIAQSVIDESGVNGPTSEELAKYDRLSLLATGELAVDSDGRYIQNIEGWSRSKKYPAKENGRLVDGKFPVYWILDNTGNPDFQLEFEMLDFSSEITTYPENLCARYTGDTLSVYDASDPDCVYDNPIVDENGNTKWVLKDSSKLSHLFTLRGSTLDPSNPPVLMDSEVGGDLEIDGNGVTCPNITQCSRICIVPFTDYGMSATSRASGFKLKAGQKHFKQFVNYEYSNGTGEFWIHVAPDTDAGSWMSPANVQVSYQYYGSTADIDYGKGEISFSTRLESPLLGSFSTYLYLPTESSEATAPKCYFSDETSSVSISTFATTHDDFVDYATKSFYVAFDGSEPVKDRLYDSTSPSDNSSGKLTSYTFNNDTGIITFSGNPPRGRLFADYYHHSFYRLTSDGYGDLYFYGTGVIVPAGIQSGYEDWAYVDLKIVNEGGNTLNSGQLTFLARGYVTKGSVVDTVLDMNRPWDVQEGTVAETVNRTGARCTKTYSALGTSYPANRANAFAARASQTCSIGTISPKETVYVRVFWCIAQNKEGSAWVDVTRGSKLYSSELSGTYFTFTS